MKKTYELLNKVKMSTIEKSRLQKLTLNFILKGLALKLKKFMRHFFG